jgi:hypothetical protein
MLFLEKREEKKKMQRGEGGRERGREGGNLPTPGPHLDARNGKVWNLKLDPDGWSALYLLSFHAGEAKVGTHQVLLSPL